MKSYNFNFDLHKRINWLRNIGEKNITYSHIKFIRDDESFYVPFYDNNELYMFVVTKSIINLMLDKKNYNGTLNAKDNLIVEHLWLINFISDIHSINDDEKINRLFKEKVKEKSIIFDEEQKMLELIDKIF